MLAMQRRSRGQALVEFALVFPLLFFLLALSIDLFRVDWVTSTVAEAARQGARQGVANEVPTDDPFGASSGACSGTTQTPSANGSGCLTTARINETVIAVLGGFEVWVDGRVLVPAALQFRHAAGLVKRLALAPGVRLGIPPLAAR